MYIVHACAKYRTILFFLIIQPLFLCFLHHYCLQILYTTTFLIKNVFIYLSTLIIPSLQAPNEINALINSAVLKTLSLLLRACTSPPTHTYMYTYMFLKKMHQCSSYTYLMVQLVLSLMPLASDKITTCTCCIYPNPQ